MKKHLLSLVSSVFALLFATSAWAEVTSADLTPAWIWDGLGASSSASVTLPNGEEAIGYVANNKVFKLADLGVTVPAKNFTFSFWTKDHGSQWKDFAGFADSTEVVQIQRTGAVGQISTRKSNNDNTWDNEARTSIGLVGDEYKLLTVVQNNGTLKYYVNGESKGEVISLSGWNNLTSDTATMPYFAVGTAPQTNGNANGNRTSNTSVVDYRLYNKALTDEQVLALYNGGINIGIVRRTVDTASVNWSESESNAWMNGSTAVNVPGNDSYTRLTVEVDTEMVLNAVADLSTFEVLSSDKKLTISNSEGGSLNADATRVNGNLIVTDSTTRLGMTTIMPEKALTTPTYEAVSGIIWGDNTSTWVLKGSGTEAAPDTLPNSKFPSQKLRGNLTIASGRMEFADGAQLYQANEFTVTGAVTYVKFTANDVMNNNGNYTSGLTLADGATLESTKHLRLPSRVTIKGKGATLHATGYATDSWPAVSMRTVNVEADATATFKGVEGENAGKYGFHLWNAIVDTKNDAAALTITAPVMKACNNSGLSDLETSLTKKGSGSLILVAPPVAVDDHKIPANRPIMIEEGTLKLAPVGASYDLGGAVVNVAQDAMFEICVDGTATVTSPLAFINEIQGIDVEGETISGTVKKTGTGALKLTADQLENFTGTFNVVEGAVTLPLNFAKTATFGNDVTALTVVLSEAQRLETVDFSALATAGVTVAYVDLNDNPIDSTNGVYTPAMKTWKIETDGDIAWSATDWKQGDATVDAPKSTEAACINVGNHTVTLKIPTEGVTVQDLKIEGDGSILIEGGVLTITKLLSVEADACYAWGAVAIGECNIAKNKTLTIDTTGSDVVNPDTYKTDHSFDLPALTGKGALVIQGEGALVLTDKLAEPTIRVQSGTTLHLVDANDANLENTFNLEIEDGAVLRFSTWSGNYGNAEAGNTILLKGGSEMIVSNGGLYEDKHVYAAITIDATEEKPAKIYGAAFNTVTLYGGIIGSGLVEFAEGKAYGTTDNFCDRTLVVAGTIADANNATLKVKISDLANQIEFAGANTYSGKTEIAKNAILKVSHASALGSGAVIGEGTVRYESQNYLPTNEVQPNIANGKFTNAGTSAADGWRGSVELKGVTQNGARNNILLDKLGNANSTLILNGVTGWFKNGTYQIGRVVIGDGGLTVNDGLDETSVFTGILSGSGSIAMSNGSGWAPHYTLKFSGDVSDFSGNITVNSDPTNFSVVLGNGDRESGKVVVATGATAKVSGTWTSLNGISVIGVLGGTGIIACATTFGNDATLDVRAGALNVTGAVEFGSTLKVKVGDNPTFPAAILAKEGGIDAPSATCSVQIGDGNPNTTDYMFVKTTSGLSVAKKLAQVGDRYYASLAEAITAASVTEDKTLTLTDNYTMLSGADNRITADVTIVVPEGVTLTASDNDQLGDGGNTKIKVYGTLDFGVYRWPFCANNQLTVYTGATVKGDGNTEGSQVGNHGAVDVNGLSKIIFAKGEGENQETVNFETRVRTRSDFTFAIESGVTVTVGEILPWTGDNASQPKTITVTGGTLSLTDAVNGVITLNLGDTTAKIVKPASITLANTVTTTVEDYEVQATTDDEGITTYSLVDALLDVAEVDGQKYKSLQEAVDNASENATVKVLAEIDLDDPVVITQSLTLDLNEQTIKTTNGIWDYVDANSETKDWSLISVQGGTVIITGNGTLQSKKDDGYAVDVRNGASVIIQNGTFTGNISVIYAREGNLTINGGTYTLEGMQLSNDTGSGPYRYTINAKDDADFKVSISGGTFYQFNPAASYSEITQPMNFCAEGYGTKPNGDYYDVIELPEITPEAAPNGETTITAASKEEAEFIAAQMKPELPTEDGQPMMKEGELVVKVVETTVDGNTTYTAQLAFADTLSEDTVKALTPEVGVAETSENKPIEVADTAVTLTVAKTVAGLWYGYATGSDVKNVTTDYTIEFKSGNGTELKLSDAPKGTGTAHFYKVVVLPYKPAVQSK